MSKDAPERVWISQGIIGLGVALATEESYTKNDTAYTRTSHILDKLKGLEDRWKTESFETQGLDPCVAAMMRDCMRDLAALRKEIEG